MTTTQQYIPLIQKLQNENWAKYLAFQMQNPSHLSECGIQMVSLFSVSNTLRKTLYLQKTLKTTSDFTKSTDKMQNSQKEKPHIQTQSWGKSKWKAQKKCYKSTSPSFTACIKKGKWKQHLSLNYGWIVFTTVKLQQLGALYNKKPSLLSRIVKL